jgi:integration host factor subunit beta
MTTTITKKEVARRAAKIAGEKIYLTEKIVDGVFAALREVMGKTNPEIRIDIRDFGVFAVRTVKAKNGARQTTRLKTRHGVQNGRQRPVAPDALTQVREKLNSLVMPEEAERWLHAKLRILNGRRPIDLIQNGESNRIMEILVRLEEGIHT